MQQTGVGAEGPHASVPAASASKAAVESKHVLWPPFVLPFHSLGITLNPQPGHHLHHSLPTAWAPPAPLLHLHGLGTTCTTLAPPQPGHHLHHSCTSTAWAPPAPLSTCAPTATSSHASKNAALGANPYGAAPACPSASILSALSRVCCASASLYAARASSSSNSDARAAMRSRSSPGLASACAPVQAARKCAHQEVACAP